MNAELVQIGKNKKDNTSFKKNVLKKIQKQYKDEWEIVGAGISAPSKMPGFGYSTPASACITGAKLREIEGSSCHKCYAFRGNYPYPVVQNALHNRLYSLSDPMWVPAMALLINEACGSIAEPYFRWHDSGDLQGIWHLESIIEVCKLTPKINHWLPTREYAMIKNYANKKQGKFMLPKHKDIPSNLVVRFSAHMVDGIPPSHHWNTSTITSNNDPVTVHSVVCESFTRDGFCGDCRKCWNKNVADVSYPKH
jgi:hypothetical protein